MRRRWRRLAVYVFPAGLAALGVLSIAAHWALTDVQQFTGSSLDSLGLVTILAAFAWALYLWQVR